MSNQLIHYIDMGEFYTVYGIATLIVVLMLLWYFVRSNLEYDRNSKCSEYMEDFTNHVNYTAGSATGCYAERSTGYSAGCITETSQPDK